MLLKGRSNSMDSDIKKQLIRFYDKNAWEPLTVGEHLKMWSDTYADKVAKKLTC